MATGAVDQISTAIVGAIRDALGHDVKEKDFEPPMPVRKLTDFIEGTASDSGERLLNGSSESIFIKKMIMVTPPRWNADVQRRWASLGLTRRRRPLSSSHTTHFASFNPVTTLPRAAP